MTIPPEAIAAVPAQIATTNKVLPIAFDQAAKKLTVVDGQPRKLPRAGRSALADGLQRHGQDRRSGADRKADRQALPGRRRKHRRNPRRAARTTKRSRTCKGRGESIDLDTLKEAADSNPGPQADQPGAAAGDQGQGVGHSLRAVRRRIQDALPHRRRAVRNDAAAGAHRRRPSAAASRSWRTWTSPSGACRRTAASS